MGKSKSQTQTTESTNKSWLMDIPGYKEMAGNAVASAGNMPNYVYEGFNQNQNNALTSLSQSTDQSQFEAGAKLYQSMGQGLAEEGRGYAQKALASLEGIRGMTTDDYNKLISSYTNSDLVNRQKAQSTEDINKELAGQMKNINQSAVGSGNMGSSRAGVATGVAATGAQREIARANLGIDQAAYQNALGMTQYQLGQQTNIANSMLGYGQQAFSTGLQAYNTGLNWSQQVQSNKIRDINNLWQAGSLQQQNAQSQADINRLNLINQQNPYLGQLQLVNSALLPMAGLSQYGINKATTSGGGNGLMGGIMGAAGAAVGGYFGGPMGAQVGAGVGGQMGQSM